MPVLKRKSKIVTFRVSPEEYDALAGACAGSGDRSISAFARNAAIDRLQMTGVRPINISGDLASLGKLLTELDGALSEASDRIHRLLGDREASARAR